MTFYAFMMKKYLNSDCIKSDLAKDMRRDKRFPKSIKMNLNYEHLMYNGACDEALLTFYECWEEYTIQKKIKK